MPNLKFFNYLIIILLSLVLLSGCATVKKKLDSGLSGSLFKNSFHGLVVQDANSGKLVYDYHGDHYFTPASNVKIFTFYASHVLLPKNIPTLQYASLNDTLYVEGTGDPSWMHPFLKDSTGIEWLKNQGNIALCLNNFEGNRFGPGWAWEDYDTYFSPEITPLPLYGNVVSIYNGSPLEVFPNYFKKNLIAKDTSIAREEFSNRFYLNPNRDSLEIPFRTSHKLTQELLEQLLNKKITLVRQFPDIERQTLAGMETDSIYRRMLIESDNFLAEQLLLTASSTLSDTLGIRKTIAHVLENDLSDLQHPPRWVDGSGLSRYNLFTPKSMVQVLQKLHNEIPEDRLFALFPVWNDSGTVQNWNNPEMEPFIYAKSGSLGNNYNLSGYLKTNSGKLLLFSFMNNHFRIPTSQVRAQIYQMLYELHVHY